MTDDLKARAWALLAIGLAVTAVPAAAAITIARELLRCRLGGWRR